MSTKSNFAARFATCAARRLAGSTRLEHDEALEDRRQLRLVLLAVFSRIALLAVSGHREHGGVSDASLHVVEVGRA